LESNVRAQSENLPEKKKSALRENAEAILLAILLALFIRTFVVQAFKIPSGSMKDTLLVGDHILVNKFIYGIRVPFTGATLVNIVDPQRGDIVVFRYPEEPDKDFIKRVVGVPGDVIEGRNKQVWVNGQAEHVAYAYHKDSRVLPSYVQPRDNFGPLTVPADSLFVMGDNRDESYDSRFWGFVSYQALKGKAFMIYWSWNSDDFAVRWGRIGDWLH
jgi:signal peptidase I